MIVLTIITDEGFVGTVMIKCTQGVIYVFFTLVFSGIVVSLLIVLVGVLGNGDTFVSRATAEDTAKPYHGNITKIEKTYTRVEFDLSKKRTFYAKAVWITTLRKLNKPISVVGTISAIR